LLNLVGFVLRDINSKPVNVGDLVDDGGVYKIGS